MNPLPDKRHTGLIRKRLLAWFEKHARDLPWRRTRDPYQIWISEVMLQQTQVDTVIPYYEAFIARFGDVAPLARARSDTVMKLWAGLGYYSRARNLHAAAKIILREHRGRFPSQWDEILRLPGIGRYTAGAIASIAFGRDKPVVDGNVTRVLCRLCRIEDDPKTTAVQRRLWTIAETLLPPGRAGEFNQALMELGATMCSPRQPACKRCPLHSVCAGHKAGCAESLPVKSAKKSVPRRHVAVAVIVRDGCILAGKRRPGGLLGGLWELPAVDTDGHAATPARVRKQLLATYGIDAKIVRPLEEVTHVFSHFKLHARPYMCTYAAGRCRCDDWSHAEWVTLHRVQTRAWSSGQKKLLKLAAAELAG